MMGIVVPWVFQRREGLEFAMVQRTPYVVVEMGTKGACAVMSVQWED